MENEIASPSGLLTGEGDSPRVTTAGRSRFATSTLFLVDGMTFGTWAALIPSFQQRFNLTAGQLSWVLFGLILGAMVSMPLSGQISARYGSHRLAFPAALAFSLSLIALALAPSYGALIAAAVLFGALKGALDIAVNAQAITAENAYGRPIMSSFQAFWSLGGLTAAFFISMAMNSGYSATFLILLMSGILFLLGLSSYGGLLPDGSDKIKEKRRFTIPDSKLLRLGGLAFLALFCEGVLLDWSAVYAHKVAGVSVAVAPIAFAAFALCMAGGRFSGDFLIMRFGSVNTMRISGLLMALGIAVAVIFQSWAAVLVGFATVGFGVANLVPILFGAAGRVDEKNAGPGLATVTTLGYLGFLSGPPMIGALAAYAGLPIAFIMVIIFGTVIATFGITVVRPLLNKTKEKLS